MIFRFKSFGFDQNGNFITLSQSSYEFLLKYKIELEKLNYYAWAKFLEKINLAAKSEKFCQTRKIAETNFTFIKAQFKNYNENLIPRLWQYAKFSGFRTMQTTYFIQPNFGNLKVAEP